MQWVNKIHAFIRIVCNHLDSMFSDVLTGKKTWLINYLYFGLRHAWMYYIHIDHCQWRAACLCWSLMAFEQGGIFIVPHMRRYKTSVLAVSFDGPSNVVAFCVKSRGLLRIHSNKGPHVKYYGLNGCLSFYYNYSAFIRFLPSTK